MYVCTARRAIFRFHLYIYIYIYIYIHEYIYSMSDNEVSAEAYITGALMDLTYCYICYVDLGTVEDKLTHDDSVVHIIRSLKLMGKPLVICVDCHSFVLMTADAHCASSKHLSRMMSSRTIGPSLQVVRYQRGLATDEQLAQLVWTSNHFRVLHTHQAMHMGLFIEYQRGEDALRRSRVLSYRARRRALLDRRAWEDYNSYHAGGD